MFKKILLGAIVGVSLFTGIASARWTNSYTRKDGTFVNGYYSNHPTDGINNSYNYYVPPALNPTPIPPLHPIPSFTIPLTVPSSTNQKACPDLINGFLATDGTCYCNKGYDWDSTQAKCSLKAITLGFDDIEYNSFKTAILYVKNQSIVDGYSDNTYRPSGLINRAELTKIVINALGYTPTGNNCFTDVKNEWFAPYVCTAKEKKILDGYEDGSFKPSANINQAEAVKILVQAFNVSKSGSVGPQWYDVFMNSARNEGLFRQFVENASDPLLRGEMAQLIFNIKSKN